MPPRLSTIRQMASLLLGQRGPASVGEKWPRNFINRQKALKSKYNRKYDYQYA
jgi:hypothetical protein